MRFFIIFFAAVLFFLPCVAEESPVTMYEAPLQITLTFTGDCTLGNTPEMRGRDASFESFVEKNGLEYPFANVKELFEEDDLTIINLEGLFHDSDRGIDKEKTYRFRAPTSFADMLPLSSVEVCYMGNNHVYDYGNQGYQATTKALDERNIPYFATTQYDNVAYIYEKGNAKIGFVSIYTTRWKNPGMGTKMKETIQKLKEEDGCSVVIACIHAGVEYDIRHDTKQVYMADSFIRNGADIVIGNHPHVIQGLRVADGKTTLWSLGNFVFGGNKQVRSIRTYIARFTLSFAEDGTYLGHQLNIIPAHMSGTETYNNYQPVLISDEQEAAEIMAAIQLDTIDMQLAPYQPGIGALQEFVPAQPPEALAN